jgi:hypothetical protein
MKIDWCARQAAGLFCQLPERKEDAIKVVFALEKMISDWSGSRPQRLANRALKRPASRRFGPKKDNPK